MIAAADFVRSVRALAPGSDLVRCHQIADALTHRWHEPHRHYHGALHLAEVVAAGEELRRARDVPRSDMPLFHLAAWYHDAVYDVHRPGNEDQSASLARKHLTELQLPSRDVAEISLLISMTTMHEVAEVTPLRAAFHDADLWILSAPMKRYRSYREQVRREYAHVPEEHFVPGRRAVLVPFFEREWLYLSAHARKKWEPKARENLRRELADLS